MRSAYSCLCFLFMLAKRFIEMTTVEVQLEINDRSHIVHIKENGEDIDAVALVFCQENGLPSDEETVAQISDSLKGARTRGAPAARDRQEERHRPPFCFVVI